MRKELMYSFLLACICTMAACNRVARVPIDDPARVKIDNTLLGKWVMKEDTLATNYFIVEKKNDFKYALSYMNKAGTNAQYDKFEAFLSKVNNARYLNIQYYYGDVQGYFFLKILDINEAGDEITTACISDTTMLEISKPAELRARVARNLNNPLYFADTAHFFRVKGF